MLHQGVTELNRGGDVSQLQDKIREKNTLAKGGATM
jgi:hypothetical protein